jgi:peptidoglycan/LPS O-acetylase OafA/YrhL
MKIRGDIQFLRGIAVLLVVFYHAKLPWFESGFLGVDVFFVISGFLITGLIKKGIEANKFSFVDFYYRRAKRLLPAAYLTFSITLLLAYFLLTSTELKDFYSQMIGAATFTANMVLWGQGTYFGVESDLKPLLHTWSLSVEEQYYLIVPALMVVIPRKYWSFSVILAFILSLIACLIIYSIQNAAAFYLFPTRAWELLIGTFGALYYDKVNRNGLIRYFFWPSLIGIIYIAITPIKFMHPGPEALLICIFTLVVILISNQHAFNNYLVKPIIWVGDLSYSLYLIHWPIFAFTANIWISDTELPYFYRFLIIFISIFLAHFQYKYVENRFRYNHSNSAKTRYYPLLVLSLLIISVPAVLLKITSEQDNKIANNRMGNTGLGQQCTFNIKFEETSDCITGDKASVLVWGDSNAMHLIPGLVSTKEDRNLIQATKYVCGPIIGISPIGNNPTTFHNQNWANSCISFNNSVFNYLKENNEVNTIIMSSFIDQYLSYPSYSIYDGKKILNELSKEQQLDLAVESLLNTINSLRSIGKKVVFIAPPPAMMFDAGRCEERKQNNLLSFGNYANCIMPYSDILELRKDVYLFMDKVIQRSNIEIIKFDEFLLKDGYIMTNYSGVNIFIANAHLSYQGSEILAQEMNLLETAIKLAK